MFRKQPSSLLFILRQGQAVHWFWQLEASCVDWETVEITDVEVFADMPGGSQLTWIEAIPIW